MTNEEAAKILKDIWFMYIEKLPVESKRHLEYRPAICKAIDALKKDTPMKPYWNIVHYPNRTSMGIVQCPMCKRRLRMNKMTKNGDAYCPDCGQAIDWDPEESRLQSDTLLTEEVRDANDK